MIIVALLATSIMLGLAGAGGGASLRSPGRRLAVYIVLTTVAAAALGSGLVALLSPAIIACSIFACVEYF